ncbi:MAG: hypothetical protein JAZ19_03730 [Candidatus Thiodiazotropha taylori]|nr:hypothetical protein [Candidatus Thiodiazotropha taylori]
MSHWHEWSPHEQKLAEAIYSALDGFTNLGAAQDPTQRRIDFTTLFRCVTHPEEPFPAALQKQLTQDPKLREDFHHLLKKCSSYHIPRAAAASSGDLTERTVDQFRIRLRPSRVESDQLYILIELPDETTDSPSTLFLYDTQGGCLKQALPAPQEREIQLLMNVDNPLVLGLKDHNTEIFLR